MKNTPEKKKGVPVLPLAIVLAGVILAGAIFLIEPENKESLRAVETSQDQTESLEEPSLENISLVSPNDHILGSPNAKVFIIEYSDIECPFCKQLHQTMHEVIKNRGKTGQVAWVYRHFPIVDLHPKALDEAIATECAAQMGGNSMFWDYIDLLFEKTPSNNQVDLTILPETAAELGLDKNKFNSCLSSKTGLENIEKTIRNGLESGVSGTPVLVFVGQGDSFILAGNQSTSVIESAIDLALSGENNHE